MKKKSKAVCDFIASLHKYITTDSQFRSKTKKLSEVEVQREIRPIIISFLENYFKEKGFKDARQKANKSFYWEGQEGIYGHERSKTFGARNYPDFIITSPYLVAVEYKQSDTGSMIKNGIGQSIMHTLCEEFHFVYLLFRDQSDEGKIKGSISNDREQFILEKLKTDFNVFVEIV